LADNSFYSQGRTVERERGGKRKVTEAWGYRREELRGRRERGSRREKREGREGREGEGGGEVPGAERE
jgi:hypothetical protein